jgi:beta-mannosidase
MNILRLHGGSIINKDCFYDICDELGILIWQEFPLACNQYNDNDNYLKVLNDEGIFIVKKLRKHPCNVIWCAGNELFNNWSKMTDQSHAIRLLNKICYEYDRFTPFLPTSPVIFLQKWFKIQGYISSVTRF